MLLSAAFLAGLAAIAVPVIVHLIHRQRYPDRPFTTLRFFDKTIKQNVIQRKLIDRILLALRVLALIALAVGLSRPFWHAPDAPIGERRMSMVIVLDNSPSMARTRGGKPLMDQAREAVAGVLKRLGPADRVEILLTAPSSEMPVKSDALKEQLALRAGKPTALILDANQQTPISFPDLKPDKTGKEAARLSVPGMTTDSARLQKAAGQVPDKAIVSLAGFDGAVGPEFGYDHDRLGQLLQSVKVSSLSGDMPAALQSAKKLLADSRDGDRQLLIVSDLKETDWQAEPDAEMGKLNVKVLTLAPDPAIGPNLAIDGCTVSQPLAGLGQVVTAMLTVHNYGPGKAPATTLHLVADRNPSIDTKVPAIAAGASQLVAVPIRVSGRDHMLCTATIDSSTDPFPYDNSWNFQVGVRAPVTALCVNGVADATGANKSTFFVMNALAMRGGGSAPSADARECEIKEIKDQKLFQYAVILLADVPALDLATRTDVRQFVTDGGGLLVFGDPAAKAEEYKGWDFLPAQVVEQKPAKGFLYLRTMDERATAVADVRRRAGATIHGLTTNNSLTLDPREGAVVLARFSDGSPALVEGRVGKGRVIFVGTSCHVSKSEWPLQPAFVLLVRELVQYLGNGGISAAIASDRTVGQGAAMAIAPERAAGTPAIFRLGTDAADTIHIPLPWYRQNDRMLLPLASDPGQYLLTMRPDPVEGLLSEPSLGSDIVPISVNHDVRQSKLAAATEQMIQKQLPRVEFEPGGAATFATVHAGMEIWRWLVIGALIFLLVEGLIAWRWASETA